MQKGEVEVEYYLTEMMTGNSFTKLLQGSKFYKFRKLILGMKEIDTGVGRQ